MASFYKKLPKVLSQLTTSEVTITGPITVSNEVEVKNDIGNPLPVSALALPLPAGAATLAEQQTQTGVLNQLDTELQLANINLASIDLHADGIEDFLTAHRNVTCEVLAPYGGTGAFTGPPLKVITKFDNVGAYVSTSYINASTNLPATLPPGTSSLTTPMPTHEQIMAFQDADGVQFLRTFFFTPFGNFSGYGDTELDGETFFAPVDPVKPVDTVVPKMAGGGNISVTSSATGSVYVPLASQTCKQLTVSNQTGVLLEFQQGGSGTGLQIPNGAFYTFFGLSNTNQIAIRRVDQSNTQVTVTARWES